MAQRLNSHATASMRRGRRSACHRRCASCNVRSPLIEALERRIFLSSPADVLLTSDPGVQQMPSIAADPLDSRHLVVAYMDRSLVNTGYAGIGVRVSHDGGSTWQNSVVPLPAGFDQGAADPVVRFDAA